MGMNVGRNKKSRRVLMRKITLIMLSVFAATCWQVSAQTVTIGITSYTNLQAAINAAQPGDTVQLSSGIFGATETAAIVVDGKTNITIRGQGMFQTTFRPASVNYRLNPNSSNPSATPWAYAGGGYWPKPSSSFDDVPVPASSEPWRPYIYVANSEDVRIENMGFDFSTVTGTNRTGGTRNVAIVGMLAHNITGMVISNVSLSGLTTANDINQETMLALVNDADPYSPANKGTIDIVDSDFYNVNRGGIRARWFVDVHVRNTKVQKSPSSDTLSNAISLDSLVDFTFENSLISGFANPFGIWQSTAFLINNNYRWPGHDGWVGPPPAQTVNIINSTVSEAYYGVYVLGSWTRRELTINITDSVIADNRSSGIHFIPNDANYYADSSTTMNIDNSEITGNGYGDNAFGAGILHGSSHPRNLLNVTGSVFADNNNFDYRGVASVSSNGTMSLNMTCNVFEGVNRLRVVNHGESIYNISGNYYGEANPDIMSRWVETVPVPVITNILTAADCTAKRRVLTVCDTCPHTTLGSAVAAATGDDLIYVFSTPTVTSTLTISTNRTMWTRDGIIIEGAGDLVINEGAVLTLDGQAIAGPVTINTSTVGVLINQAPLLQADATSLMVRGLVAWTPCFVDVYALLSPTNSAPVGNTTNGWAVVQLLNPAMGMNVGSVSGMITNLSSNVTYAVQLVGIVSSNLPANPRGLTHPSMGKFAVNVNNCDKNANFWCGWRTSQHYTQLVVYASTTNSTGGFWLEDGDTVWNDDAPLGYPAGSPTTITWGALRALVDAGENMPGLYDSALAPVAIPLDDPRSQWRVYLSPSQANACGFGNDRWAIWNTLFYYSDLTNAFHTNACWATGNVTLYSVHFSDWSDYNKLVNEIAIYGNEVRLVQNPPIPCAGSPNIYSARLNIRLVKEVDVPDILSAGTVGATDIIIDVEVDDGQTVRVDVYQGELGTNTPFATTTLTTTGSPEFADLLTEDGRWYVVSTRSIEGGEASQEFGVERRTYQPNTDNLVSMVWEFGTGNTMNGRLGEELSNGLLNPGFAQNRDRVFVRSVTGVWMQFEWTGIEWVASAGNPDDSLDIAIDLNRSFWIRTSSDGSDRVAIYRARPRNVTQGVSIAAGDWVTLAWPLPFNRTEAQGWGFPRQHGSDNILSADWLFFADTFTLLYLGGDGRWRYAASQNVVGDTITIRPGGSFLYRTPPGRPTFTWLPR
jgi:hypothetical protein